MDTRSVEFHRQLRSLFAVLRAIVRRTSEGQVSVEAFAAHLEGRIGALARVHEMLMRGPDAGIDLEELTCGEMLAQSVPAHRYKVAGPDIRIAREAATPVALALHEMAVNASIHGAFAAAAGNVEVAWERIEREGAPWLRLCWRESGPRPAGDTVRARGFGFELLERTLPYELSARTTLAFGPEGLSVELLIPERAGDTTFWHAGDNGKY